MKTLSVVLLSTAKSKEGLHIRLCLDSFVLLLQKSKLQADCEREIAQIRWKYETKISETEAEYLVKRNKLQLNENMVLMNKILAEAFHSKCMDVQASAPRAVHKGMHQFYTCRSCMLLLP